MRVSSNKITGVIIIFIVNISFLTNINASECNAIYIKNNKSFGIIIKDNNCSQNAHIARGAVLELIPRGRLWFKSMPSDYVESEFQLICQNRSEGHVQLDFSDMLSPWLSLAKLNNCSGWVDNKLSCGDGKTSVYCVLAPIKIQPTVEKNQIKRTTSVKMRTIKGQEEVSASKKIDKKRVLKEINTDLKLCKQLNQITRALKVRWTIEPNHRVSSIEMVQLKTPVGECVKAVVSTFSYPNLLEKMTFKSTF